MGAQASLFSFMHSFGYPADLYGNCTHCCNYHYLHSVKDFKQKTQTISMSRVVSFQVCRVAYCKHCAKRGAPQFGQWYAVFGSGTQKFHFGFVIHTPKALIGFTPHLFIKGKASHGLVFYERVCLMNGCGITVYSTNTKTPMKDMTQQSIANFRERGLSNEPSDYTDLLVQDMLVTDEKMNVNDWNALVVNFRGWTGYKLD